MPLPSGFLRRYRAFLAACAAEQHLPEEELDRFFIDYPESVLGFLVASREQGGATGFADAFRLLDLIEGLGCALMGVDEPDQWDPVELAVRRGDNSLRAVTLTRSSLNLARPRLLAIVRQELDIERGTDEAIAIRPRPVETDTRMLRKFGDRNLPHDPNAPASPTAPPPPAAEASAPKEHRARVTRAILTRRPPDAGPDHDDGREPANPLAGLAWGDILRRVSEAAAAAGCKRVQIAKVGTGGIVRLEAAAPKGAKLRMHLAPAALADQAKLREVVEAKVTASVRAAEQLRLAVAQATAEVVDEADAAAPPAGAGPDPAARLTERCLALGYQDVACTAAGGGRYLRVEANADDGVRLTIALAVESLIDVDDAPLDERLAMLFERARGDLE